MTDDQQAILDELMEVDSGLRGKDIDFLDSLDRQRERNLSQKQLDWLNDLADRHL